MNAEAYLNQTRTTAPIIPEMAKQYNAYHAYISSHTGMIAQPPPLQTVYSMERRIEIATVDDGEILIFDQHLGGIMNTLNRLYLNARHAMDMIMVGMQLASERLAVTGKLREAFVTAFNYTDFGQQHQLTYLDERRQNAVIRSIYTAAQEVFLMAHPLARRMLQTDDVDGLRERIVALSNVVAQSIFGGDLNYSPFTNPMLNLNSDLLSPDDRVELLADTIATMLSYGFVSEQTTGRAHIIAGIDLLTRHLAVLDAIDLLCAGQWKPNDTLNVRFLRRRNNIRSTLKAIRTQFFVDSPGVDISDVDKIYHDVLEEPLLKGLFPNLLEMLQEPGQFDPQGQVPAETMTAAYIGRLTGFLSD